MPAPASPTTVSRRAFAKVNLALSVGPPEGPAGMHPVASWMAAIELHDDLSITRLPDGSQSRYSVAWAGGALRPTEIDWPLEKDLAVRAHRLLEQHAGRQLPVELALRKRTPAGGGLGGGSSDAASTIMVVNALFGLGLDAAALGTLSAPLGSDIAFFIDEPAMAADAPPRPAIVTGFGNRIERITTPGQELVLLIPPFGCPTGAVYKAYDQLGPRPLRADAVRTLARRAAETGWLPVFDLFNDLAEPACHAEPRLAALRKRLAGNYLVPIHITGSGSTMFLAYHHDKPPDALTFYEETARDLDDQVTVARTRIVG